MKIKISLLLTVLAILMLLGCSRQRQAGGSAANDSSDYAGATLTVGKGGGFAGTVREYRLLDSGELFVKEANAQDFQLLKKKNHRQTKRWFARLQTMNFTQMNYQKPGNVYQFISLKTDSTTHQVTWSGGNPDIPVGLAGFYNDFMKVWASQEQNRP